METLGKIGRLILGFLCNFTILHCVTERNTVITNIDFGGIHCFKIEKNGFFQLDILSAFM